MTTIAVLLRSLVRVCQADCAVVARAGADAAIAQYGLSAAAAVDALRSMRFGTAVSEGLRCSLTLPLSCRGDVPATLYVLSRDARVDEAFPKDNSALTSTLNILATEIGQALDRREDRDADPLVNAAQARLDDLIVGVDALNDAAIILEWPIAGVEPRILYINSACEELLGYPLAAAAGRTLDVLYGALTERERTAFMLDRVRETREARIPIVYYRRDGVPIWVEVSVRASGADAEGAPCVVATLRDVSTRKEFEDALSREKRKLQVTLAAIGDGVITTVADGRIDYVNYAARAMLGIDAAEAYGEPLRDVLRLNDSDGVRIDVLHAADASSDGCRGQAQYECNASVKYVAYVSSPIGVEGYVIVLRDVTAQQHLSSQLSYEASHDPLTKIYNRRKFERLLEDAIDSAQRNDGPHVLGMLDLDRFKHINDHCGHAAGDRVLLDLAHRLQAQLRGRDVLARIGGDEFSVLLHDCSLENGRNVIEKLRRAVETYRVFFDGIEYSVGVSIGITVIDGSELDAGILVARADAACYEAKSRGRNAIAQAPHVATAKLAGQ